MEALKDYAGMLPAKLFMIILLHSDVCRIPRNVKVGSTDHNTVRQAKLI